MRDRSPGVLSLLIVMLAAAPALLRKPTNHRSRLKIRPRLLHSPTTCPECGWSIPVRAPSMKKLARR